jgi:hypothetical protein
MNENQPAPIPPSDPNPPVTPSDQTSPAQTPPAGGASQPPAKKKKRRLWLKVVVALVALVVLLIALIPTILSTGAVRSMVVGKVNDRLNVKLEVQDWSFGWLGGVRIHGVKIVDGDGRQILQLKSLDAPVSFIGAMHGNYDLHKVVIDGLDVYVRREADGSLNFARLAKSSGNKSSGPGGTPGNAPSSPESPASPPPVAASALKLPAINGEIVLTNCTGTYDDIGAGTTARAALAVDEKFATTDGNITLIGSGDVTGVEMRNAKGVQFSESDVHLANDLGVETGKTTNAKIKSLLLDMQGSKALSFSAKGNVNDLDAQRAFEDFSADLTYNAATLWKIVLPLLSKDTQDQLKDAVVSGQFTKHFVVSGGYPANVSPDEAMKALTASGGIALAGFKGNGIDLQNLVIPFFLKNGKATLANSDKPGDVAAPASLNSGTLSLAGIAVDMTDPHHPVSMPPNTQIMKNVALNAPLADMLAKKCGNPLFVASDSSSGLLSVLVEKCDQVPTDDTMKQKVASNKGMLAMDVSIQDLTINGGNLGKLVGQFGPILDGVASLLGGKSVVATGVKGGVKNYKITLANGVTTHDMTIVLGEGKRSIHFGGDVTLATMALKDATLTLPLSFFRIPDSRWPNGINAVLTGTVTSPKLDPAAAVQKSLVGSSNPLDLLNSLGGKKKKNGQNPTTNPSGSNDDAQKAIDALQGLIPHKKD